MVSKTLSHNPEAVGLHRVPPYCMKGLKSHTAANALMVVLEKLWRDHHIDMYSKYMIFWAIPWNLLLWGFESWAFRQSPLEKLDVFLHRNIRRILGTRIGQVRECHIKNSHIRKKIYNIPCVRNQVVFKQLTCVGKIMRCERSHVPTIILTSWCDNPRKRGGQVLTKKDSLVCNLQLIIPGIDDAGLVSTWGFYALDTTHWFLFLATIKHPANTTPYHPPN